MRSFKTWGIAILVMPFFLWGCKSTKIDWDVVVQYGVEEIKGFKVDISRVQISTIEPNLEYNFSIMAIPFEKHRWVKSSVIHESKVLVDYMKVNEDIRCLWLSGDGIISYTFDSLNYAILDQKLFAIGLDHNVLYQIPEFLQNKKRIGRKVYVADVLGYTLQPSILKLNNTLYFPITAYGVKFNSEKDQFGVGSFNLDDFTFEVSEIPFPSFFDISHVGFLNNFYLSPYKENKLLVTYALKPVGMIYDPITKLVEDTISFKSVYDTLNLQTFDRNTSVIEKMWKTILYDGSYRGFVYNPAKKHYYCLYQIGQPEDRPDGLKNTQEDRRTAFIILNENLEVIYDRLLPESIKNGSRIIPHDKGALFLAPLSEEKRLKTPKGALEINISYE